MGYYQDVVVEYLRENRAIFINTECCIQLHEGTNNNIGPHWYCDALAVDFAKKSVYLCEVTYALELGALLKRLSAWNANWPGVKASLERDCRLDRREWSVMPWVFIPERCRSTADAKLKTFIHAPAEADTMPFPKITSLECIVPWNPERWTSKEAAKSHQSETPPGERRK